LSSAAARRATTESRCNLCDTPIAANAVVFVKDGYEIARCPSCGLLFRRHLPEPAEVRRLYEEDYFRAASGETTGAGYLDYLGDEDNHRRNARRRLDLLAPLVAPGRVLDVGCAAGFFLDEAGRRGWSALGIDVAPDPAAWGREELGLEIVVGQFLEARLPGSFDAITMWDYLEHTLDPRAELERAASLLRRGGILGLSTGDAGSYAARVSGPRWHLLTPRHHNFYFTKPTLRRYLEQEGLELVASKYLWSFYSVAYVAHKLQTMSGNKLVTQGADLFRRRAARVALPINLFDIVTVLARKT
jgi:2-polyprenyl-3-methyl-5-hydroxy-6-metoxy-1,4-benzoquinol methylase